MNTLNRDTIAGDVARTANLDGRQVIITGATSGLGTETARALAMTGANLVLGVRNLDAGRQLAAVLQRTASGSVRAARLDLADLNSVRAFAEQITGPVDVLINRATLAGPGCPTDG